jgi:glycosyltransferase involved in cell wall biosynthesis
VRVLIVAHHLPPRHVAGTEVYAFRLAAGLAKRHEVTVFATDDDPLLEPGSLARRREGAFDVVELAEPRLALAPSESWRSALAESTFARVLDEVRPDVCHFQHLRFLSMALPAIAKRAGVATVMTLHDYWLICARDGQLVDRGGARCPGPEPARCAACLEGYRFGLSRAELLGAKIVARVRRAAGVDLLAWGRRAGLLARRIAPKFNQAKSLSQAGPAGMLDEIEARRAAALAVSSGVDIFIAPSKFLRGVHLDAGFTPRRFEVLGHGADPPSDARPAPRRRGSGPLRIGFAGTVTPLKGVDLLIEAARKLPEGSYVLDVHGRDDLRPEYARRLKALARGLPIRFHGAFEPGAAAAFVREWDVAVVPSRWVENQPLAILEAFACGVPVVAANLGGMRELVKDGIDGRLFAADDAASLAGVLSELASDERRLLALRAGVVAPPDMAAHAAAVAALYEEAAALR